MRISDEELEHGIYIRERQVAPEDLDVRLDLRDLRKLARALLQDLSAYSCGCSSIESTNALKAHLEEKPVN